MAERKNKIVFSERIDGIINGLTLGISFILVGLFLLFVPNYFGNQTVGEIVRWIFIAIGILGLIVEFNKLKTVSKIEGLGELWTGIFFIWLDSSLLPSEKYYWKHRRFFLPCVWCLWIYIGTL